MRLSVIALWLCCAPLQLLHAGEAARTEGLVGEAVTASDLEQMAHEVYRQDFPGGESFRVRRSSWERHQPGSPANERGEFVIDTVKVYSVYTAFFENDGSTSLVYTVEESYSKGIARAGTWDGQVFAADYNDDMDRLVLVIGTARGAEVAEYRLTANSQWIRECTRRIPSFGRAPPPEVELVPMPSQPHALRLRMDYSFSSTRSEWLYRDGQLNSVDGALESQSSSASR